MSIYQIEKIRPPTEGTIRVVALTTSASAEQDLGLDPMTTGERSYLFISDVDCYITFSSDGIAGSVNDPDETAVTGDGRTFRLPAGMIVSYMVQPCQRYFKVKGSTTGYLRYYPG